MRGSRFQKDTGNEILSEINVIPLVDISLVLLIIFMVTANYIVMSSFAVDVPVANSAKAMQQPDMVNISISREGILYLQDKPLTSVELKTKMKAKRRENSSISVVLSADKNVNFKNVVSVLDLLSELGITRLNIAAVTETKE